MWLEGLEDGGTHPGTLGTLGVTLKEGALQDLEGTLDTPGVAQATREEGQITDRVAQATLEGGLGATQEDRGVQAMAETLT